MKKLFRIIILILVIIGIIKAIPIGFDYFFPCTYKRQVEECAEKDQVDKNLIFAIIKAESNFNKDAVSKKGAKGLMQLMDETGQWCAQEIGISECELTDVECNINAGTFYFSHLLKIKMVFRMVKRWENAQFSKIITFNIECFCLHLFGFLH